MPHFQFLSQSLHALALQEALASNLVIDGRIETRGTIASSVPQVFSEGVLVIPQLGSDTAREGIEEEVAERATVEHKPVVPANETAKVPLATIVLDLVIVVVGDAPAARGTLVGVVDDLGAIAIHLGRVGGVLVVTVAGGRHALDDSVLDEDDDVLPVVLVTAEEPEVALEIVLIP